MTSDHEIPYKLRKIEKKVIVPILDRKYTNTNIPLTKFHVLKVFNKKLFSKLLTICPKLSEEFEHLKRIRNGCEFLLEQYKLNKREVSEECMKAIKEVIQNDEEMEFLIVEVPSIMPLSKIQRESVKDYWPVKCKRNKEVDDTINEVIFKEEEKERIIELFEEVELTNGVIIYDPNNDNVIVKIGQFKKEHPLDHPVRRAIDMLSKIQNERTLTDQYLATGYYIILGEEICAMCGMALVHSRVNKVFFGKSLPNKGAFISNWRMMEEPKINHHYSLFRIECQEKKETNVCWNFKVSKDFKMTSYENNKIIDMNYDNFINDVNIIAEKLKYFNNCMIGVCIRRSVKLVVAIVGIIISGNAFVILEENNLSEIGKRMIERFQVSMLLTESGIEIYNFKELKWKERNKIIMYGIQSSGTTGIPKVIHVPYSCILPNIECFYEKFKINSIDNILCSTSFSFDPSIIEIFLPIIYGCKLVLVEDNYRSQPSLLCDIIKREKITFMQTTPSFIKLLTENSLKQLLSSTVRTLLIGGEEFPFNYLKNIILSDNCKLNKYLKIFNVYGITEVSCWASIKEITLEVLKEPSLSISNYKDIADILGSLLSSTSIEITASGKILIGGQRQCSINYKFPKSSFIDSGDLIKDGIFIGRRKYNGMLRDYEIESFCYNRWNDIKSCKLIYGEGGIRILFISLFTNNLEIFDDIKNRIYIELKKDLQPNDVVKFNDNWPINKNGKIDENELLSWYINNYNLNFSFLHLNPSNLEKTLREMGMDSLKAVEINYHIQCNYPNKFPNFLQYLLSPETTVSLLFKFLKDNGIKFSLNKTISLDNIGESSLNNLLTCTHYSHKLSGNILWTINMYKCIDSNVIIFNECCNEIDEKDVHYIHFIKRNLKTMKLAMVGSHSGLFVLVNILNGNVIFKYQAEGRIEGTCSDVFVYKNNNLEEMLLVAVPTYAGEIILIDIKRLKVIKVFKIMAIVKSKPIYINNGYLWFGGYDKAIYIINLEIMNIQKLHKVDGYPLADGVVYENKIIFSLLSGTIYCFSTINMEIVWKTSVINHPSFSKPTLINLEKKKYFIITSPEGFITIFNVNDGNKFLELKIDGQIFDSAFIRNEKIIVSGTNGIIYILEILKNEIKIIDKKSIFEGLNMVKNIKPLDDNYIGITTDGKIWIINCDLSHKECIFDTKAKVFSFPTILKTENNEMLLIYGARDNFLRCISFK